MSDAAFLAPLASALVGLAGAMVAGLSVYFTYKGRHNQFRQVVYGRQMDAYFDITESMSDLYTAAQNVLAVSNPWLKGEDARAPFRTAVRDEHERFTGTVNRSLIVLPSKVKAAVDHFNETLLAISDPAEERPAGSAADRPGRPGGGAWPRRTSGPSTASATTWRSTRLTTGMLKEMGIGSESVTLKNARSGVKPAGRRHCRRNR